MGTAARIVRHLRRTSCKRCYIPSGLHDLTTTYTNWHLCFRLGNDTQHLTATALEILLDFVVGQAFFEMEFERIAQVARECAMELCTRTQQSAHIFHLFIHGTLSPFGIALSSLAQSSRRKRMMRMHSSCFALKAARE
jgi:hypothetical protein